MDTTDYAQILRDRPRYWRLDRDTHEVFPVGNVLEWASGFEIEVRRVARTELVLGEVAISTVFLGLDHSFSLNPNTPPLLFETMIFGGPLDGYQERHSTWDEAYQGHLEAVRKAKHAQLPWNYMALTIWNVIPYRYRLAAQVRWHDLKDWIANWIQ